MNAKNILATALSFSALTAGSLFAQTPVDAKDGITFGDTIGDPTMGKSLSTQDLEVDVVEGTAVNVYRDGASSPVASLGQGYDSSALVADSWYRIASGQNLADAVFHLTAQGGGESSKASLKVSAQTNSSSVTTIDIQQLSSVGSHFTTARVLSDASGNYHLEVSGAAMTTASYVVESNTAWTTVDWTETTSVPTGFTAKEYNLDNQFMVAADTESLTVEQDGSVEIGKNASDESVSLKVETNGNITIAKPQGDITMGVYGQ
jgi:hypothetical protein